MDDLAVAIPLAFSAFLMDLDGTVIDSKKPFIIAYDQALVKNRMPQLPSDEREAIKILRKPAEDIYPILLGSKSRDPDFMASFLRDLKEAYGEVYLGETNLCPSVRETIKQLKVENHKVCIVSSRFLFADFILPMLDHLGIGDQIDLLLTSKDVSLTKPHPDPFLLAAERLKKRFRECVVIGDSPEDVIAGKAAGMFTVSYTGGFYSLDELLMYKADLVVDDLMKITQLAGTRLR